MSCLQGHYCLEVMSSRSGLFRGHVLRSGLFRDHVFKVRIVRYHVFKVRVV